MLNGVISHSRPIRTFAWAPHALGCCLVHALATTYAQAAIVFDNGTPDLQDGHGSDFDFFVDFRGGHFFSQVADEFALASNAGPITGVTWWGDYGSTGAPPQTEDFTIRFFNDVNGLAAVTPFASFDAGGGNRIAMGSNIYQSPGYGYSATIAPLTLDPNATYWLSIVDNTTSDATQNFYWATSNWTQGDGLIRNGGDNTAWRAINGSFGGAEEAFQLTDSPAAVPEPTSLLLFGMGFMAFGCHRLRSRRLVYSM